jgi:hypothetical protein
VDDQREAREEERESGKRSEFLQDQHVVPLSFLRSFFVPFFDEDQGVAGAMVNEL